MILITMPSDGKPAALGGHHGSKIKVRGRQTEGKMLEGIVRDQDRAVTLENLEGRNFATVQEVASILEMDPRTIRDAIKDGDIPAIRAGREYRIPVAWLRTAAGQSADQVSA